jgi:hypothetical protein
MRYINYQRVEDVKIGDVVQYKRSIGTVISDVYNYRGTTVVKVQFANGIGYPVWKYLAKQVQE